MAALKPTETRGFILPDLKLAVSEWAVADSGATATQAGGVPGLAVPTGTYLMALQTSGEVWTGETLTVTAIKGGHPIPGASAARTTWSGTASIEGVTPRGWLPYNVCAGFCQLVNTAMLDGATYPGVGASTIPDVLRLSNGDVIFAFVSTYLAADYLAVARYDASVGRYKPSYGRYDSGTAAYVYAERAAWSWTASAVATTDTGTAPTCPRLLELPTGRLLMFFTSVQSYLGGAQYHAVGFAYSDDSGVTWTLASKDTGARILIGTGTPTRLDVAYTNGYLTLLLVYGSAFVHYVSSDDGSSFTEIATTIVAGWSHSLIGCDDGTVLMFFIRASDGYLCAARKYFPQADFIDTAAVSPSGAAVNRFRKANNCLAATLTEDRTISIVGVTADDTTNAPTLRVVRFPQSVISDADEILIPYPGQTREAEPVDYGAGTGSTQYIPSVRAVCVWGSSLLTVWDQQKATPASVFQFLGGYSSIDWNGPTFGIFPDSAASTRYGAWWDAAYLPSTLAIWTVAGAGAEGSSVEKLLSYDFSGGASTRYQSRDGVAGADVWLWARVRVDAGGSLATNDVGFNLRAANGTSEYLCSVRLTTTAIRLYDDIAAATKGTDVTGLTASSMVDVLASLTMGGRVTVWYKYATSNVWIQGPYGSATAKVIGPAAVSRVQWGCFTASTQKSTWAHVGSVCDNFLSLPVAVTEPAQPRYTFGREVSIWPTFVADGTAIAASSGPAAKGESWTITPAYTYPMVNLDPTVNPAPSLVWRSSSDQAAQAIVWDLGAEDGPDSALIGIYLQGANFLQYIFEQDDGGAGWTTMATVSTVAIAGDFVRTGFRITADVGDVTGSLAVGRDELANSWAVLTDAGSNYYIKILHNSQGTWNTTSGILTATLTIAGTAAALSGLPTSGTIQVIAPEVSMVCAAPALRQSWRIRIPARTYASATEAYHQAAVLMVGPYVPCGWTWSNARTLSMEPVQRIAETETGKRTVTALAPRPRRTGAIVWTDAVPGEDVLGATAVPQAISASFSSTDPDLLGFPIAHLADPRQVEDLILRAVGARYPVILLPRVPMISVGASGGNSTITGRDLMLYGRIINGSTRTEPVSVEGVLQITTISELRIDEEIG